MKLFIVLVSGILFGLGLSYGQMIDPNKVINFLDITGTWDPSLAFVMGGALVVNIVAFHFTSKRKRPLIAGETFRKPSKQDIDKPLLIGAALFGIGWGIAGYCPGPMFASVSFAGSSVWLIIVAYSVGTLVTKLVIKYINNQKIKTDIA
ncbi:MAG: YeeE/YedE family protein [Saccharospirillaceae bacterium]|nr:YeeE/YedE family protein [Pseudomonadales bacterium]NRB81242.1 YeeE/YedE family protein [Saccharospirillaceae bacterium]